jgi:glycosyltransferase involved in cell wall biosynthesis
MTEPRVLQVMAGAAQGGAEAFFTRLVPALARAGIEQHVVLRREPVREAALAAAGLKPVGLRFGGPLDLVTPFALRREIEHFRPNVVLSWMNRASAAVPRRHAGYSHVARLGGYYQAKYYRGADFMIGNTRGIVLWLGELDLWPPKRIRYLPNFVDATPAPPLPRAQLDTPADAPLLLCLGRLHRNKAFDVALRALATMPEAHLWLAGEGPERPALEQLAHELGVVERVRWLGWRDDTAALYAAADLVLCPSRIEPLGNVVIEAWAHGVPVVAAASDGPRELIVRETTGLLVPIEDDIALAAAAVEVLRNPSLRRHLVTEGRAAYESAFSEVAVVRQYGEFLREAACAASPA